MPNNANDEPSTNPANGSRSPNRKRKPKISRAEQGAATRERILRAAQEAFGEFGYDGASLRKIAAAINIDLPLLIYHFGRKDKLYREIFIECGAVLSDAREKRLAELTDGGRQPSLDELVEAYMMPWLDLAYGPRPYPQMMIARAAADKSEMHIDLVSRFMDPTMQKFVEAFKRAAPHLTDEAIHWALHIITASAVYVVASRPRIERVSAGICETSDPKAMWRQLAPIFRRMFPV